MSFEGWDDDEIVELVIRTFRDLLLEQAVFTAP